MKGKTRETTHKEGARVQIEDEGLPYRILQLLWIYREGMGANWADCKCNLLW